MANTTTFPNSNGSNGSGGSGITYTKTTERFTISSTDVTNGYIDLSNNIITSEHLFVILNGIILDEDSSADFTAKNNRLTFSTGVLIVNDKLVVKYSH